MRKKKLINFLYKKEPEKENQRITSWYLKEVNYPFPPMKKKSNKK